MDLNASVVIIFALGFIAGSALLNQFSFWKW